MQEYYQLFLEMNSAKMAFCECFIHISDIQNCIWDHVFVFIHYIVQKMYKHFVSDYDQILILSVYKVLT